MRASIRGCRESDCYRRQSRWQQNLRRDQVLGSLSYFKDGWSWGVTTSRSVAKSSEQGNRNLEGHLIPATCCTCCGTAPQSRYPCSRRLPDRKLGLWMCIVYANDSWQVSSRLTLNLGLRFDRYRLFLPEQAHPAGRFNPTLQTFPAVDQPDRLERLAPRVGLAMISAGDGNTLFETELQAILAGPGDRSGSTRIRTHGSGGSATRGMTTMATAVGIPARGPEVRPSRWDRDGIARREARTSSSREGPRGSSASSCEHPRRTGVVWRGQRQHYSRQDEYRPFDAFTVPFCRSDPGRDGESAPLTTAPDFSCTTSRGPQSSDLSYNVFAMCPPPADHLDVGSDGEPATYAAGGRSWRASRTWTRDQATGYFGQAVRNNVYPLTPNDLINAGEDGRYEFRMWSAKIQGPEPGRAVGAAHHAVSPPSVRAALRPHVPGRTLNLGIASRAGRADRHAPHGRHHAPRCARGEEVPLSHRRFAMFVDVFNVLNANPEELNLGWSS